MSTYAIYEKNTGKILSILGLANDDILIQQIGDNDYLLVDYLSINRINNSYVVDGAFVEYPPKPDHYSIFNYEKKYWEYPSDYLDKIKSNMTSSVNSAASEKILSRYSDHAQRNILASGDTDLIAEAWDYINPIRDLSNSANDQISSAQDTQEIEAIYQDYLTQLMEL